MKKFACLAILTLFVGCGGGEPEKQTPEKKAEMSEKMNSEMSNMKGDMKAPSGTPKPKAPN